MAKKFTKLEVTAEQYMAELYPVTKKLTKLEVGKAVAQDGNRCFKQLTKQYITGLFDANNNLIKSLDVLINDYGMRCDIDYTAETYATNQASPFNVLKHPDLVSGVKLVIGGNNITRIGNYAFYECDSLVSVEIGGDISFIQEYAFGKCNNLKTIIIGKDVAAIDLAAFSGCSSLTSVKLPDSVTRIGYRAFEGCDSLESITIPFVGATKDGTANTAYLGHLFGARGESMSGKNSLVPSSLKNVEITGGNDIGQGAFCGCQNIKNILLPNSLKNISGSAFDGCISLEKITIPDSVTSIGQGAFSGCSSLTSIAIPDSVTSIGGFAFTSCISLTSVVIGNSVRNIGTYAYVNCRSLTDVYYRGTVNQWKQISIAEGNEKLTDANIHYNYKN